MPSHRVKTRAPTDSVKELLPGVLRRHFHTSTNPELQENSGHARRGGGAKSDGLRFGWTKFQKQGESVSRLPALLQLRQPGLQTRALRLGSLSALPFRVGALSFIF